MRERQHHFVSALVLMECAAEMLRSAAVASAYQLVSVSGLECRYHVVRPDGLPDVPLTLFANEQLKSLSPSSVPLYVREISHS